MSYYVGVDLGGTKIAGGLLDSDAQQLTARKIITTEANNGPDAVLKRIAGLVRSLCEDAGLPIDSIAGVGLGVPATLDLEHGTTLLLPNMPGDWNGKPVVSILTQELGVPVSLINDARAFTLAEANLGAARGAHIVAGITLGTGIGGGIAVDGRILLGINGAAGEFGHHTIDMHGPPDGSGNAGGFEGYGSGPAIAAMGAKAVMQGITTRIGDLVNFDLNRITPGVILQAAEEGDPIAQEILERAGFYLGTGLANIITILAPNKVVIGGGLVALGDWIMKPMHTTIEQRCHTVPLDQVEIVLAALGGDAGVIGAAVWASQQRTSNS
jgi:glucokinase